MGSVFLSYRREDSAGQARALFQDLTAKLGKGAVFMDVDGIALGRDFREVLQERLATCDLMLVLIGRDWLSGKDASGRRRLDDPADFVRLEIAAALKRNIAITPLLLQGAQMPAAEQLPENIRDLAYRNGFELSHNRWESDVQELMKRLGLAAAPEAAAAGAAPAAREPARRAGKRGLVVAAIAVLVLAGVAGAFLYRGRSVQEPPAEAGRLDAAPSPKNAAAPAVARAPGVQGTHRFDDDDSRLKIDTVGSYRSSPFTVENLDLEKDFRIEFQIRSTRPGGSTRYGIAWNYSPDDFMLFTLHSTGGGYFSIGPGRSRTLAPFSRLAEGPVAIQGESGFDTLQMTRNGSELVFAVNGRPVWRTADFRLSSGRFAFWVADLSEATIRSYTVQP
jgi:hypothetical protein